MLNLKIKNKENALDALKDVLFAIKHNYIGTVDDRFKSLAELFSRLQDSRTNQGGAALTVYFQGEKVVDICTGQKSKEERWSTDTLSVCYSTGKGILATLAHILVSEGLLDYDVPVCTYWPEFAQNGKSLMTLRHILSHQTGLYDIRNIIHNAQEMANWQHMLQVFEQAKPRFDIGQDSAYQALTFGWLVGGMLEKATGQTLQNLMQQYLVEPLGLDGAFFGVPQEQLHRVARLLTTQKKVAVSQEKVALKPQIPLKKAPKKVSLFDRVIELSGQNPEDFVDSMIPKGMKDFSFFSDVGLQAIIPAANGVFTANSLAKIYAMLANKGEWQGKQIIHPEVFSALSEIQTLRRDRVMPIPMHWRLGYHRVLSLGKHSQGFGHIGYNGSGAWCDPNRQLSFAYTHNFMAGSMVGDYRLWGLTQEALRCADGVLIGRKGWF